MDFSRGFYCIICCNENKYKNGNHIKEEKKSDQVKSHLSN